MFNADSMMTKEELVTKVNSILSEEFEADIIDMQPDAPLMEVLKEIIYWILYTLIAGGGILFFGAVLVHDTIELTKDAFGIGKEEPSNKESL